MNTKIAVSAYIYRDTPYPTVRSGIDIGADQYSSRTNHNQDGYGIYQLAYLEYVHTLGEQYFSEG